MYPLAIVTALLFALMIAFNQFMAVEQEAHAQREVQTLSSNAAVYLGLVKKYVRANSGFSGDVPDSALGLPTWYGKLSELNCYAASGSGYLYLTNVSERQAFEAADLMQMPYGYGKNVMGTVRTPRGETFSVPSQVPNGAFVIRF